MYFKLLNVYLTITLLILSGAARAGSINAGEIAFTGWNADVNDAFSFVALTNIDPGESIIFTDNEWDGSFFNSGEGEISWTADSAVMAGSIVSIYGANSATAISVNTGVVSGTIDLNVSNEALFAVQGSLSSPTTFLTAFATDGNAGFGSLLGTGLAAGLNAIDFAATPGQDDDIFEYIGPRSGQLDFSGYLSAIHDTANWIFQGGTGGQHMDGLGPDIPFARNPFTITSASPQSVPEPASLSLMLLGLLALASRKKGGAAN